MSASTPKTILLKTNGGAERTIEEELVTDAALTPGEFVIPTATGVRPHNVAADVDAPKMVCVENPYIDPRVVSGAAIDHDYEVGEVARIIYPQAGDLVYAWLEDEGNVAKGAALESDGAGALQAYTSGRILAFAAEAVNNTGGSGPVRIKVRIA